MASFFTKIYRAGSARSGQTSPVGPSTMLPASFFPSAAEIAAGAGSGRVRLHHIAEAMLLPLELPSMYDLGFLRDPRGRNSRDLPLHRDIAKMIYLWRAAQSGKTRKIQEIIKDDARLSEYLNIVICANIMLQADQTAKRMREDCFRGTEDSDADSISSNASEVSQDDRLEGNVFTWLSSGLKTDVRGLADDIKEDKVKMIVCCSNKRRFTALMQLLENLESSRHFNGKIKIWIDEADASVSLWSKKEFDFTKFSKLENVCLVSATFNSVVRRYGRIRVLPFPDRHPDSYVSLSDCELWSHENELTPTQHVLEVLGSFPELCKPGVCLFAPALVERVSHNDMEAILHSAGFAVLILNGERKEISFPDGRASIPVRLSVTSIESDELSKYLPKLLAKYEILSKYPFACTGQLCLGRGITFQSSEFLFDAAILPDLDDPAGAYQCVARMLGNFGHVEGRATSKIFFSRKMRRMTLAQERIAIHIAKEVSERGWADVGVEEIEHVLSQGDPRPIRVINPGMTRHVDHRTYATEAEAKGVLKILAPDYTWYSRKKDGDFYVAAVNGPKAVVSYAHTVKHLAHLTGGKGKTAARTMYVPCYLDPTDATTLRYVVPIPDTTPAEVLKEIDDKYPEF